MDTFRGNVNSFRIKRCIDITLVRPTQKMIDEYEVDIGHRL